MCPFASCEAVVIRRPFAGMPVPGSDPGCHSLRGRCGLDKFDVHLLIGGKSAIKGD